MNNYLPQQVIAGLQRLAGLTTTHNIWFGILKTRFGIYPSPNSHSAKELA